MAITIHGTTYTSGYTHGGKFHADDICSAALLRLMDPSFPIVRGFRPPQDENVLVFDIGNGLYDHHSEPRETRPNDGVQYAAFGKLWRDVQDQFPLTDLQRALFDRDICAPMDYADNTGRQNPLSEMLGSLNPAWDETTPARGDELFFSAVCLAQALINAWLTKAYATNRAAEEMAERIAEGEDGVVVSERYVPTTGLPNEVMFFVCPSQRGGWQGLSIRHRDGSQLLFPREWWGTSNLPAGISFCHGSGFLATFDTKELAVETCRRLVREEMAKIAAAAAAAADGADLSQQDAG